MVGTRNNSKMRTHRRPRRNDTTRGRRRAASTRSRAALARFIAGGVAPPGVGGGGDRSPRRGGAAHLRVHLQDDSRRKLCSAGGWTAKTSTAEEYAGLTIEATRHWSRLMVRPVTLL